MSILSFKIDFEGESRVGFTKGVINPRDQLGKIGIRIHQNPFERLFVKTVAFEARLQGTDKKETWYLNKNSAIQWINAQKVAEDQISTDTNESTIVTELNKTFNSNKLALPFLSKPKHTLSKGIDKIMGLIWNAIWNVIISCWNFFKARFAFLNKESTLETASQSRANAIFWEAEARVPAYKNFVNGSNPKTFEDIPITAKSTYINPYNEKGDTHLTLLDGKIPLYGQCNTSTGTTGKPTMWIRGKEEQEVTKKLIHFGTQATFGDKPLFFINTFALGPWATGLTTSSVFFDRAMTFSPGPDIDKIFEILEQFRPDKYPDRKYIIAGYPPFIKNFVQQARERGFDLSSYNFTAVVGGEAISDTTREHILKDEVQQNGIENVISAYGASDLDVPIGQETDFTHKLRKICAKHPEFAEEIFGSKQIPMVFQYDPLNYYIESNEEQQLIYTCVRQDRCSPRIRYNLKDLGKTMRMSDLKAIAKKHQIELPKSLTNLPLLCIRCRDGAVTYGSMKIPIEDLEKVIASLPEITGKVKNCAFRSTENNHQQQVSFLIEFKGEKPEDVNQEELTLKIIEKLKEINPDFCAATKAFQNQNLPSLELFDFGKSPMANLGAHQKRQYLFS